MAKFWTHQLAASCLSALLLVQLIALPVLAQTSQKQVLISRSASAQAQAIVSRMLQANQLPPNFVQQVYVEKNDVVNAYTNGQSIRMTTNLWDRLDNNDEKAFVLGHELAHVYLKHIESTGRRKFGLGILGTLLSVFLHPVAGQAAQVGIGLVDKKFSRNLEYQADELGVQFMQRADYNPSAAIEVFKVLKAASASGHPEFLRSHPIADSRIRSLAKKYELSPVGGQTR